MLENLDKIMYLRFNFDACPMHSPSGFVQLMHQNLSAHALFCLNSLAKVNTQLLIYNYLQSNTGPGAYLMVQEQMVLDHKSRPKSQKKPPWHQPDRFTSPQLIYVGKPCLTYKFFPGRGFVAFHRHLSFPCFRYWELHTFSCPVRLPCSWELALVETLQIFRVPRGKNTSVWKLFNHNQESKVA